MNDLAMPIRLKPTFISAVNILCLCPLLSQDISTAKPLRWLEPTRPPTSELCCGLLYPLVILKGTPANSLASSNLCKKSKCSSYHHR